MNLSSIAGRIALMLNTTNQKYKVWTMDENAAIWTHQYFVSKETDTDKIKDDLNKQWEESMGLGDDDNGAELGPAQAVDDVAMIVFNDEYLPDSGPGWIAEGYYGRLETILVWRHA